MKNRDTPAMPASIMVRKDSRTSMREITTGLTKREHFAGLAMQSIISNHELFEAITEKALSFTGAKRKQVEMANTGVCRMAIQMADALLEELEKDDENNS